MSFLGVILKEALRQKNSAHRSKKHPYVQQLTLLTYLLRQAAHTHFGTQYAFDDVLRRLSFVSKSHVPDCDILAQNLRQAHHLFSAQVPTFTYDRMYKEWWHELKHGAHDVSWPGHIPYFALSSGTSQGDTKRIPVTNEMLRRMRLVANRQVCTLSRCALGTDFYSRSLLFLSSSTQLCRTTHCVEGDISGIFSRHVPFWLRHQYRPSTHIARLARWEDKLEAMVDQAPRWDIGGMAGSPTWLQLLLERIIDRYGLSNIHEIWPSLQLFVHGGVSMTSYRAAFNRLVGKHITYLETYLASEGFIAYQANEGSGAMRLALDGGLFYEFVPFVLSGNERLSGQKAVSLVDVALNTPYELLVSSLSGLWRYALGDVIVFHSLHPFEISIQGRTQHYVSVCGEHVCVENLEEALAIMSAEFNLVVKEFTVFGQRHHHRFAHVWHIGIDVAGTTAPEVALATRLDAILKEKNADYRVQREGMLQPPQVVLLPSACFYEWLAQQGRLGGQYKFPRVLSGSRMHSWEAWVARYSTHIVV